MSQASAWIVLRENNLNAVVFYLKDKKALSTDTAVEFTDDLKFKYTSFPEDFKFVNKIGEKYWIDLEQYNYFMKRNNLLRLLMFLPFIVIFCALAIVGIIVFASIFLL